jgi:hypothetical protein
MAPVSSARTVVAAVDLVVKSVIEVILFGLLLRR